MQTQHFVPGTGRSERFEEGWLPFGVGLYAETGRSVDLEIFNDQLTNAIELFMEKTDKKAVLFVDEERLNKLRDTKGVKSYADQTNQALMRGMLTEETYKKWLNSGRELSFEAYIHINPFNYTYPLMEEVIFVSDSELDDLINRLNDLRITGPISEAAESLEKGLLEMAKRITGEENEDQLKRKTINEIWQILFGIEYNSSNLANTPIFQISNADKRDVSDFISGLNEDIRDFDKSNLSRHIYLINQEVYYWIPLDEFPGND